MGAVYSGYDTAAREATRLVVRHIRRVRYRAQRSAGSMASVQRAAAKDSAQAQTVNHAYESWKQNACEYIVLQCKADQAIAYAVAIADYIPKVR